MAVSVPLPFSMYFWRLTDLFAVQRIQGMDKWIFLVCFLFVSYVNFFVILIALGVHLLMDPSRLFGNL